MTEAYPRAAAWWDADAGPPKPEILPRAERLAASFESRILAHVLGKVARASEVQLGELPWVIGSPTVTQSTALPELSLRRALTARGACVRVHAGPATVPMTLVEAIATLVDHEDVMVAFIEHATPPYNEAWASALLLSRRPSSDGLHLRAPYLRRGPSRAIVSPRPALVPALTLARAVDVGEPTVETVPTLDADRPERWRIELCRASRPPTT